MNTQVVELEGDYPLGEWTGSLQTFRGMVNVLSPKRLEIIELLETKAPNPNLAVAYCCYLNTVIFYVRPYTVRSWHHIVKWRGRYELDRPKGHSYQEWDRAIHKLRCDSVFTWNDQQYEVGCGSVFYRYKRWWMKHGARLREVEASA